MERTEIVRGLIINNDFEEASKVVAQYYYPLTCHIINNDFIDESELGKSYLVAIFRLKQLK